jgi:predicted phage-related endonuclease
MMAWGLKLEPLIIEAYEEATGSKVDRRRRKFYLEGHPYIGATVDGRTRDRLVEVKFSPYERDFGEPADGALGLPLYVRCQVQHQMMVTGAPRCDVPVLLRGYDLRIFEVDADPDYIAMLKDELIEWYAAHVLTRTPPVLDDPEQMAAYLQRQPDDGSSIAAPASLRPVFRQLAEATRDKADAEHRQKAAQAIIKATMGLATYITGQDISITWRHTRPRTEVAWDLVAMAQRRLVEEVAPERASDLDTIEGLYTHLVSERRFGPPRFTGELAELATIKPQVPEEEPDAIADI